MGADAVEAISNWQSVGDMQFDGLWPDNVEAFEAFLAVSSQWRTSQSGGGMAPTHTVYVGLDYSGVRIGLAELGIETTPHLWRSLRIIEAAARDTLNARL